LEIIIKIPKDSKDLKVYEILILKYNLLLFNILYRKNLLIEPQTKKEKLHHDNLINDKLMIIFYFFKGKRAYLPKIL